MSTANSLELGMLALINDERAEAGLEPLRLITLLNEAAENHSAWMLETNAFSHEGVDGTSPSDRMEQASYPFEGNSMALENIGWQSSRGEEGFVDDVAQVHASLMNSAGHRANILNPNAEDIGIGVEIGTFTTDGVDYEAVMVTQVFGATDADISAWVDPGTGDEGPEVIDDQIVENDEDMPVDPDTPEAEDDTVMPDDVVEEPTDSEDDEDPIVAEDMPEDDTTDPDTDPDAPVEDDVEIADVPVDEMPVEETPAEDATDPDAEPDVEIVDGPVDDMPEEDAPSEDMPEVIAIEDAPGCPMTTLTVDISDVFEIKRDGEQISLETTEDKLITAFLNAFDDWAFLNEMPDDAEDTMDVSDLMIDGVPDDCGVFSAEMLEDDAEVIAAQCM